MLLDSDTLKHELELLDGWKIDDNSISRVIPMHNWKGVLMLANAIAHLAEQAWHHPDLMLTFSSITIKLTTHDEGGITDRDIILAKKIDALVNWDPKAENKFMGTPHDDEFKYIKKDNSYLKLFFVKLPKLRSIVGSISKFKMVDVNRPPIIIVAMGPSISFPG